MCVTDHMIVLCGYVPMNDECMSQTVNTQDLCTVCTTHVSLITNDEASEKRGVVQSTQSQCALDLCVF